MLVYQINLFFIVFLFFSMNVSGLVRWTHTDMFTYHSCHSPVPVGVADPFHGVVAIFAAAFHIDTHHKCTTHFLFLPATRSPQRSLKPCLINAIYKKKKWGQVEGKINTTAPMHGRIKFMIADDACLCPLACRWNKVCDMKLDPVEKEESTTRLVSLPGDSGDSYRTNTIGYQWLDYVICIPWGLFPFVGVDGGTS